MHKKLHDLKVHEQYYRSLITGEKKFEIRKNDRGFRDGDMLLLREYDSDTGEYTGRKMCGEITYMFPGGIMGIDKNYCVLSLSKIWTEGNFSQPETGEDLERIKNNIKKARM